MLTQCGNVQQPKKFIEEARLLLTRGAYARITIAGIAFDYLPDRKELGLQPHFCACSIEECELILPGNGRRLKKRLYFEDQVGLLKYLAQKTYTLANVLVKHTDRNHCCIVFDKFTTVTPRPPRDKKPYIINYADDLHPAEIVGRNFVLT
jgi:hypothetical protein